ncbi:hypothetical protein [Aeromonas phage phiWae14]|nr:hypothetical protein [Aeromonas phage phiWae14]
MKIHQEQTEIYGSAADMSSGFKILASAKAFKILSSSLYKYKQRAIIRELCCNAVDGHIALARTGVDVKTTFDVTLPSVLNQQFSVRDYGIGLSEEDVTGLYCTYFASTKSNSNDEIGGFGLGCKSPFAYTDTFTVTSWHGGFKRIYSAFMKNGEPNIMKMFEEESNEPTGVEVTVPVSNDMHVWEQEAARVFCSFEKYRPRFVGKSITINYLDFDADGICKVEGGWNTRSQHGNGVFAVMGGVVYPIPSEYWNNTMIGLFAKDKSYYVRFEIGELDMTPSREELSLDPDTIASIDKRIKILNKVHDVEIDKIFAQANDVFELYQLMNKRLPTEVWRRMIDQRDFHGKTVQQWKAHFNSYTRPNMDVYLQNASVGVTVRKNKIRYTSNMVGFDSNFKRVIINDLKSGAGEVMMALHRLNKFRVEGALVFDVASTTPIDPKDPTRGTVGEAHKENLIHYLGYWPTRMKDKMIVTLSKVRADVLKEMKDKGLVEVKKRTGKATNVVVYENGIYKEKQMYVEDIDELKDCYWMGYEWSNPRHVTPTITIETLKSGKTKEKFGDWKSVNLYSSELISQWAAVEKKTVYMFKPTHFQRAWKNKNITQVSQDIIQFDVLKHADAVDETHFGVQVMERWVGRLESNVITKPLVDQICNNGKVSEIGNFLRRARNSMSDLKLTNGKSLHDAIAELERKAYDIAYVKVKEFEKNNPLIVAYTNSVYSIPDATATNIVQVAVK